MKAFFDIVRKHFGPLKQSQVEGIEALLSAANGLPERHIAYVLATAYHETARTMQPIREYGRGKGKKYGVIDKTGKAPYGRGYVQLTWAYNYKKADDELGLKGKLIADYDLALDPAIAARIMVRGMVEGWFNGSGKGMPSYNNFLDMRRTVNVMDKAETIAGYADKFLEAVQALETKPVAAPVPVPVPDVPKTDLPVPEAPRGLLAALIALILSLFSRKGST